MLLHHLCRVDWKEGVDWKEELAQKQLHYTRNGELIVKSWRFSLGNCKRFISRSVQGLTWNSLLWSTTILGKDLSHIWKYYIVSCRTYKNACHWYGGALISMLHYFLEEFVSGILMLAKCTRKTTYKTIKNLFQDVMRSVLSMVF